MNTKTSDVSKENIHVLHGATPHTQDNTSSESDVPLRPTRDDILHAIDTIKNESHEGDYVHIHYSDGSIIRDVELGVLLEQMVQEKKLIVSVTLDCCHAGGALRDGEKSKFAIRQQTTTSMPHNVDWIGRDLFNSSANSSQEHGNWF
ncbi:uncharacterized protein LTHEOB_11364 [Lasiodiplodia theobromae]|uniref:uncharacterized protein n=1 Tax=Lasiodiplodia theobromae TaxID=45133 RepID=UPI0015C3E7EB|nr:uncharacterized protein LTHEOB_11364 [Lasiodiplodia theobromae]KAF4537880.1 hypothetical protein LTHEOB_11364 [Lasiodiplodia theobromae]